MLPYFGEHFANPSAHHGRGFRAAEGLTQARQDVADVLGALTEEVIFTSGGTESINAAIKGVAFAQREAGVGAHIVTTQVEHHAVLHSAQYLERFGFEVEYVGVGADGRVDPAEVAQAVRADTVLVSAMYANNEVGTVQPIAEIASAVRARGAALGRHIPVHTDAVQAANALPLDIDALGVDLLSLSGHKFGGPKGTGVLYVRRGVPLLELISGGGQERQRRSGTENVGGAVGLASALQLAQAERARYTAETSRLRDRLLSGIRACCPEAVVNGTLTERLPNNLHVSIAGLEGESVVTAFDEIGVECSAGAACTSATWEPSHVLLAMNVPLELAIGSIRFSLSRETTVADIDYVVAHLPAVVARLRLETPAIAF